MSGGWKAWETSDGVLHMYGPEDAGAHWHIEARPGAAPEADRPSEVPSASGHKLLKVSAEASGGPIVVSVTTEGDGQRVFVIDGNKQTPGVIEPLAPVSETGVFIKRFDARVQF